MQVVGVQSIDSRGVAVVPTGEELDLRALGRSLWYRKWQIIVPTIAMGLLAFVVVNLITPRYRSEARILIEGRDNVFLRADAEKSSDRSVVDPEAVTSQVQVVLSRDLARQVIKQLKLGERPEFDPVLGGISLPRALLGLFGFAKDPLGLNPEERVLEAYYDRLSVTALDRSRVISVTFESSDPEFAARVANAVVDGYLEMQQAAKQDQARSAGQYLAGEIDNMRKKVADAEAKVEEFRSKSNLFVGSNNSPLANQQLTEVNSQLSAARGQKADAEAKAKQIREMLNSGKPLESSQVLGSELIRRLSDQLVTLRAQLAEQSATLLEFHPRIKELHAQIGDLQGQIRSEAEKIIRSLENDARIANARVDTLNASLTQLKNQTASGGDRDIELRALEREAKAQRDLLESYLGKYREATARDSLGAAPAEARVISRATAPNNPAFPKKLPIVLMVMLATLVLAAGFVGTGELLGGGTYFPPQPAAFSPAPATARPSLLASLRNATTSLIRRERREPTIVPEVRSRPMAPAAALPSSTIEDVVRALRNSGETGRRVAVLGTTHNIGTTHAAIVIGRALAKEAKVVFVDLALGSPNIPIISSDPDAPGIADLVENRASFGQVITRDRFSRMHLIAVGHAGANCPDILSSPRLAATLDALARTYDHVLVDAGVVPDLPVARLAQLVPRAVLVTADLSSPATAMAREQLLAAGCADVAVLPARTRAEAA
jgi:exopolysaccharide transport family protein